jgi:hypothetical protein
LIHKQKLNKIKMKAAGKRRTMRKRNELGQHVNKSMDSQEMMQLAHGNNGMQAKYG